MKKLRSEGVKGCGDGTGSCVPATRSPAETGRQSGGAVGSVDWELRENLIRAPRPEPRALRAVRTLCATQKASSASRFLIPSPAFPENIHPSSLCLWQSPPRGNGGPPPCWGSGSDPHGAVHPKAAQGVLLTKIEKLDITHTLFGWNGKGWV